MLSWRPGAERRWYRVTVDRDPQEVIADGLPAPLAGLRGQAELRIRPSPGGRGTELAARLRRRAGALAALAGYLYGDDPRATLRSALLQAKRVVESGGGGRAGTLRAGADPAG